MAKKKQQPQSQTMSLSCGYCLSGKHDMCPGAVRNGQGRLFVCPCDCERTLNPRCLWCGNTDQQQLYQWVCVDTKACTETIHERLNSDPDYQRIRAFNQPQPPPKKEPKPDKGRDCGCGCGGRTKGGRFLPGHNARRASVKNKTDNPD